MEARSQSAAHPNEMNFIFNLNAFSWKSMQSTAPRRYVYDVDARATREYWSIKPVSRTDRKIVAMT
jgi:hypothetical protein